MKFKCLFLSAILFTLTSTPASAKIIHVPGDSSTIQGGINGAVNGDTVLVASGTYYEHLNFYGKAILVTSEVGAESTIISKLYDGLTMVTFASGEDSNSILEGFTIQNANNSNQHGGAIRCYLNSSPTIRHNILKSNSAGWGGGINCYNGCSPIIEDNLIIENIASSHGGGIYCYVNSSPVIRHNSLIQNTANGDGGAIFCNNQSSPNINHNLLIENTANDVGIITCFMGSSPSIVNNTLDRNYSKYWGSIVAYDRSSPDIRNTVISNELSGYGIYAITNSFPTIAYCDVWNNASGNFFGCMPGAGCISADPIFCDTASHNYYLSNLSLCVGAGEGGTDIGAFGIGCGVPRGVNLIRGPNEGGRAETDIMVEFYVRNIGFLSDTFDLNITDSLSWTIVPTYYEVPLDSGEVDTVTFTVSIPYVPIGTVNKLTLTAVSQTDSTITDTAYLMVTCNAHVEGVEVTAGGDQSGYADSTVIISFFVENVGVVTDSYDVDIWDTEGWVTVPPHYDITLDTAEIEPLNFTVSIPYVPLETADSLTLLAVSKTNSLARDSATLRVTCNAYVEGWDVLPGEDISSLSNSQVTAKFYIQNTGLATDSCSLTVSDSLGWDIDPPDYTLILESGQQDSVFFDVTIPSVPVGTTDKITLNGISLTNPFVIDSAYLLVTCESYNVTITNISDVGNDQGKQVSIEWKSFPGSDPLVTHFTIFRRVDSLYLATLGVHPKLFSSLDYPPGNWQMIGTYPAYGETLYSIVAPTLKDSTISEGMFWSVFFIRAGTDTPTVYFDSPIDSGYSIDNLSPSPPIGLLARHKPAVTQLTWAKCEDADYDYHTLYRDTTSEFEPTPDNMLSYAVDSIFVDSTAQLGREYYYLVSSTDFSGNESNPSNEVMGVRYITGDANASGEVDIIDVVHLINYLFRQGPEPTPLESGDVNCAGEVTIADAVYLVRYLFKGFDPPCEPE